MSTDEMPAPVTDPELLPPWEQERLRPSVSPWSALAAECFQGRRPRAAATRETAPARSGSTAPTAAPEPLAARLARLETVAVKVLLAHMRQGEQGAFRLFRARCVRRADGSLGLEAPPKRRRPKPSKAPKPRRSRAEHREARRRARRRSSSPVPRAGIARAVPARRRATSWPTWGRPWL